MYHRMVLVLFCWTLKGIFISSLQVTVECLDEGRLVLYPQILLACFALLGTSYVHLWGLLLDLLSKVGQPRYQPRESSMDCCVVSAAAQQVTCGGSTLNPRFWSVPAWGAGTGCVTGGLHHPALCVSSNEVFNAVVLHTARFLSPAWQCICTYLHDVISSKMIVLHVAFSAFNASDACRCCTAWT